jgi:CRT-like, chloroquine-resistance transporter-like
MSCAVALCVGIASYYFSSLGGIAIVKFLNYQCCFTSWILIALVSVSTWIVSFPLNFFLERHENVQLTVSWKQLRLYFVLSIGLSVVELLNALAMSILPGSWYALLKASNIGFSMMLSCCVLDKSYHWGQMFGASLVMGGIAVVFVLGSRTTTKAMDAESTTSPTFASMIALVGSFLNAVCNVITEATLKQTHSEGQGQVVEEGADPRSSPRPSKLLLSNSFSTWTSLFSFILLMIPTVLFGQASTGKRSSELQCPTNELSDAQSIRLILSLSLLVLALSRLGERLSKHWICAADSAVTFSLVAASRRLTGVFILAALFHESFPHSMVIGSCSSALGFILHFWYEKPDGTAVNIIDGNRQYELVATTSSDVDFGATRHEEKPHDPIHQE